MNQYCRYCANAHPQDYDICYCDIKEELRKKQNCISPNKCKDFELNEIDVFGFDNDKKYKPKGKKQKLENFQINFKI